MNEIQKNNKTPNRFLPFDLCAGSNDFLFLNEPSKSLQSNVFEWSKINTALVINALNKVI